MDLNKLLARVKAILLTPKTEWRVIGGETATTGGLYSGYICLLAAVPALCGFIKMATLGYSVPFLGTMHLSVAAALSTGLTTYVLTLIGVAVVSLIVNALAPTFGGQKSSIQALKVVAYSYTASWVAGLGYLLPGIGMLLVFAGAVYSIYLLYLGLPSTMKCPPERATGYTVVTIIVAIVLSVVIGMVAGTVTGTRAMMGGGLGALALGHQPSGVTFDADSAGGKLNQWSQQMEAAGKQLEAAQKTGDVQAQGEAVGKAIAAATGGSTQVEALAPDRLKSFLPETLAGLKRVDVSASRSGALGMQVAEAKARYSAEGGQALDLEITDMGSAKGLMALAGIADVEQEHQTQTGYDKTYKQGDTLVHEQWDSVAKHGEYSVVVGQRFSVKVSGTAGKSDDLKSALGGVDLAGLGALKNEGVKTP